MGENEFAIQYNGKLLAKVNYVTEPVTLLATNSLVLNRCSSGSHYLYSC